MNSACSNHMQIRMKFTLYKQTYHEAAIIYEHMIVIFAGRLNMSAGFFMRECQKQSLVELRSCQCCSLISRWSFVIYIARSLRSIESFFKSQTHSQNSWCSEKSFFVTSGETSARYKLSHFWLLYIRISPFFDYLKISFKISRIQKQNPVSGPWVITINWKIETAEGFL